MEVLWTMFDNVVCTELYTFAFLNINPIYHSLTSSNCFEMLVKAEFLSLACLVIRDSKIFLLVWKDVLFWLFSILVVHQGTWDNSETATVFELSNFHKEKTQDSNISYDVRYTVLFLEVLNDNSINSYFIRMIFYLRIVKEEMNSL